MCPEKPDARGGHRDDAEDAERDDAEHHPDPRLDFRHLTTFFAPSSITGCGACPTRRFAPPDPRTPPWRPPRPFASFARPRPPRPFTPPAAPVPTAPLGA